MINFAIIGAGAGGQTMAAVLTKQGHHVKLYDIDQEKIRRLNELGSIKVTGLFECEATPELITGNIAAALADAEVIMIVSTTDAHRGIAQQCLPYLKDGQMIVLNPGHCGGALEVANVIRGDGGTGKNVIIAEAGDLMYACRSYETGHVYQSGIKSATPVATLPGKDIDRLMEVLGPVFPNLTPVDSVLETSFRGGGAMLHPIPSLMNINKLDAGENYDYYMEGITPSIAEIISACDRERVAVCRAMGVNASTLVESLKSIYCLEQDDLYDLLQHNEAYRGLKSPKTLTHRFIVEDTISGLVPLTSIGKLLGIATPMMDAFVELASVVCKRDYRTEGRTAEKLGFSGKTLEQIHQMVR